MTQQMKSTEDDCFRLLTTLIESVSVLDNFTEELVKTLVEQAQEQKFKMDDPRLQAISQALVALSKKNATKVDAVVSGLLAKKNKHRKLDAFLTKTFENVANSAHFVPSNTDAKTSLALALDHPTEHIRYQALVSLAKMNDANSETNDQVLTSGDVLLRRFLDDSKRIAAFMISSSLGDLMLSLSSKKTMLDTIVQALRKWSSRGEASVVEAIADFALKNFRNTAASTDADEKLLILFVSVVAGEDSNKKAVVTVDTVWTWIAALNHPFGVGASEVSTEGEKTVADLAESFGHALAANVKGLLPFCLRWSQKSEFNETPMTNFLIEVLSAARTQLASKKSKTKKAKEQQVSLDQSFRFVLKKEFVSLCEEKRRKSELRKLCALLRSCQRCFPIFTLFLVTISTRALLRCCSLRPRIYSHSRVPAGAVSWGAGITIVAHYGPHCHEA